MPKPSRGTLLSWMREALMRSIRSRHSRDNVAAELRKGAWFGGGLAAVAGQFTDSAPVLGSIFTVLWVVGFQVTAVIWENLPIQDEET